MVELTNEEIVALQNKEPAQSKGQVDRLLAELAQTCVDYLVDTCTCHEAYTSRGMADPGCEYCSIGQYILPKAKAVLESPYVFNHQRVFGKKVKIRRVGQVSSPDWGPCTNCASIITIRAKYCEGCGGYVER